MKEFQVVVIGGGINGAGLAREAAYRGFKTMLVEQGDFAQATSSQSSKLIHGGIRYLEQGRMGLVFEALLERKRLLDIAPHLVTPLRFHIPVYQGDQRPAWMIGLGCWLYDQLAGGRNLEASHRLTKAEISQLGELKKEGLKAVFAYSDAQVFDARLTLETALSASDAGAEVHNQMAFVAAKRDQDRFIVELKNFRNGTRLEVSTQVLINAAGAWAPVLDKQITAKPKRPGLKLVRGIHFLVKTGAVNHGFLTLPKGGRIVFVLPWQGYLLIGTTESLYEGEDRLHIPPSEEEKEYLLKVYNEYFPNQPLDPSQILHTYSGVRPLIDLGEADLGKMSREAHWESEFFAGGQGYWALFGGKITSYRAFAEQIISEVAKHFGPLGPSKGDTAQHPLPGALLPSDAESLRARLKGDPALALKDQGVRRYASGWAWIARRYLDHPETQTLLARGFCLAELTYLVEREKVWELEDILLRRSLLAFEFTQDEKTLIGQKLNEIRVRP